MGPGEVDHDAAVGGGDGGDELATEGGSGGKVEVADGHDDRPAILFGDLDLEHETLPGRWVPPTDLPIIDATGDPGRARGCTAAPRPAVITSMARAPYTCSIAASAASAAHPMVTAPLDELVFALGGVPSGAGGDRLVHLERLAPRLARPGRLARPLPPPITALGEGLWSHQAEAVDLARAGRSVVVATGTASGKSRCYQLPIAEAVLDRVHPGTALCLFPTKALAQDQLRAFGSLDVPGLAAATYDGDAGREERAWARANANVVLTNPEMLHGALLPHHARWATFLMRLRYVVIDELHVLRGIFGTHVAHLLRRLRRLADHYGADPTFIFSSATIGEPGRLATELCGKPTTAVTDDGSPRGERLVALWNPPRLETEDDPIEVEIAADAEPVPGKPAGRRRSTGRETATVAAQLVAAGHRTIAFCRSRKGTEVVARDIASPPPGRGRRPGAPVPGRLPGRGAS